jgi:hypothetical protein
VIQSETRMGSPWEATVLEVELDQRGDTSMVKKFSLGNGLDEDVKKKAEHHISLEDRLIQFLKERNGSAFSSDYRETVQGNAQAKAEAQERLVKAGVIRISGVPRSPTNPQKIHLLQPNWSPNLIFPSASVEEATCKPN